MNYTNIDEEQKKHSLLSPNQLRLKLIKDDDLDQNKTFDADQNQTLLSEQKVPDLGINMDEVHSRFS